MLWLPHCAIYCTTSLGYPVVVDEAGTTVMLTPNSPAFSSELTAEELLPISTWTVQLAFLAVNVAPVKVTVVDVEFWPEAGTSVVEGALVLVTV